MIAPNLSKHSLVIRFAYWLWFVNLTQTGRYLSSGVIFSCMLGWVAIDIPVFHIACALLALCFTTVVVGFIVRPRLEVSGGFPAKISAKQSVVGSFKLRNLSHFPAFDLALGFFSLDASLHETLTEEGVLSLGSGESVSAPLEIRPLKRGLYRLPGVKAFSTFPFNLWRTPAKAKVRESTLLVLPFFHAIDGLGIPVGSRYQPGGIVLTSSVGESPEYIGNRDYRAGDPLRRIDFRSWGRLARPVVREYQEEYFCRVALVLDTFVEPRRKASAEGFPDLEAGVSLSAAVADSMAHGEYIVDVFAAGPDLHVFRAGRHTAHFESVLEILASVDACREDPFGVVAPALAEELNRISAVICVFLDWDETRSRMVRAAAEAGCRVKVIVIREGETTLPLAAAEEWAESVLVLSPGDVFRGGLGVL